MTRIFTYDFASSSGDPFPHPRTMLLNSDEYGMQSQYIVPHRLPEWSDIPIEFQEGFAAISRGLDRRWNYLGLDGTLMLKNWCLTSASSFTGGYAMVTLWIDQHEYGSNFIYLNGGTGKHDFLCRNADDGKPYLFTDCHAFGEDGLARVKMRDSGGYMYIDKRARLYDGRKKIWDGIQPFKEAKPTKATI